MCVEWPLPLDLLDHAHVTRQHRYWFGAASLRLILSRFMTELLIRDQLITAGLIRPAPPATAEAAVVSAHFLNLRDEPIFELGAIRPRLARQFERECNARLGLHVRNGGHVRA